jgi:hypothetical protein
MDEWKAMDSSPRDGTPFLATDGRTQVVCFWHLYQSRTVLASVIGVSSTKGYQRMYSSPRDFKPTRWQSLPSLSVSA